MWDCVAGSVVGWYMTCVGDSKKKAPKKRPRALSIMRRTWACGALNSAPFLSCAVRTSSVLCPHEFYDCSWNNSLVPSAFCQYPEMAMEDSQGRDQVQEGRQHSLQCAWPEPPEESWSSSGHTITPVSEKPAGSTNQRRVAGGQQQLPNLVYTWITWDIFQNVFPGPRSRLRQIWVGKAQQDLA